MKTAGAPRGRGSRGGGGGGGWGEGGRCGVIPVQMTVRVCVVFLEHLFELSLLPHQSDEVCRQRSATFKTSSPQDPTQLQ